jgi:hypothetical protein
MERWGKDGGEQRAGESGDGPMKRARQCGEAVWMAVEGVNGGATLHQGNESRRHQPPMGFARRRLPAVAMGCGGVCCDAGF